MNQSARDLLLNPEQINVDQWDAYLENNSLEHPSYGGTLGRHVRDGDLRLNTLLLDNHPSSLNLWNFLLTEEKRLWDARENGDIVVGTMKDLGTIPVMAYALPNVVAFYPDGAWWVPCIMELSAGLLGIADSLGIDESFCPVRAMIGAFVNENHFPKPDLLICSSGAVCDDFSAIVQRLAGLGFDISWWEIPRRRSYTNDTAVTLPGGFSVDPSLVTIVEQEMVRIKSLLEDASGKTLSDTMISEGIVVANRIRALLEELRYTVYSAENPPIPALEMLICEMLAIHFCSDRDIAEVVLQDMLALAKERIAAGVGYFPNSIPVFWINPVADLRLMNILEDCGGHICGTEYLFSHALDQIPTDIPPLEALAQMALADPMVGATKDRGIRVLADIQKFGAKAVIISRIPGASHCASEGKVIGSMIEESLGIPCLEMEVPPMSDSLMPALRTRIEALIETVQAPLL